MPFKSKAQLAQEALEAAELQATADAAQAGEDGDFTETSVNYGYEPAEPVDYVTVLHGYGRVGPNKVHYIDSTQFKGGVARNVPREVAEDWKRIPQFRVHILPANADEVDFARRAGIQPLSPNRMAALLGAADIDALYSALGPKKTAALVENLKRRLGGD